MIPLLADLAQLDAPAEMVIAAGGGAPGGSGVGNGGRLRLRRAWPRGPDHLLLDYALPDGTGIAGQWLGQDPARLDAVARRTARSSPVPGIVATMPEHGVLLQAGGADRRLEALADLAARPGARLVVHRPERRGVVRLVDPVRWAKVVRPGHVTSPESRTVPARTGLAVASCLDVDVSRGVTTWSTVPGRTLHELLAGGNLVDPHDIGSAVGAAVRRLHDLPVDLVARRHRGEDELEVVETWRRRLADHVSGDPLAIHMPGLRAALTRGAPQAPGVVHRDLHDKQVLVGDGNAIGLLDFDTLAVGEPVLDVANLLVHVELRVMQGRVDGPTAALLGRGILAGHGTDVRDRDRLVAHAAVARARLAAVYAFRPRWADLPARLLDSLFDHPPGLD